MKHLLAIILLLSVLLSLVGCSTCSHVWVNASCTSPETCNNCGMTRGTALEHNYSSATCTSPSKCLRCYETTGSSLGHNYYNGYCARCGQSDPSYVSYTTVFSGNPSLRFYMNSAGGIEMYWKHKYIGSKKINYITVTYTLYDAVGNPTPDDIHRKSTNSVRLIGPFNANKTIEFASDVFVYCDVCDKISFDKLVFEYADGTTQTIKYGWQNTVS